jgi:lipoprotein-releasing system ATP-binding protein
MSSGATPDVVLEAEGIVRSFKMGRETIEILRGLDLSVRRGERVSVVGASGSGKTTMINVLGLLDRPQQGAVRLLGEDPANGSGTRRNELRNRGVGFIFQFYHLVNELSAVENVLLPAMIGSSTLGWFGKRAAAKERAAALLADVGLQDRMKHRPQELSGGERQRVAIARALMNDPAILFCDEPTGNLDPRTSGGIQELLLEIGHRGRAMLLVTHDMEFAERCDRVLRLNEGRLVPAEQEASSVDASGAGGGRA